MAVLTLGIAGTTIGLFRAQRAERAADVSKREAIDALKDVTKERDAKETALIAEAAQRDRAERQLANGLLRPIGFSKNSPAESRSFVDWSAIKESPLKLRVLEIALEDPETALRIARLADYVVQACVGLSPIRREQAIKLVSARQRDRTADPRIRVAACWLALQLGSADLPAWAESCNYLGDPKNKCVDRFGEFVTFAASRSDPQQLAQLNPEPLIGALEKSKDDLVRAVPLDALAALAPRLGPAQATRAWDVLFPILVKTNHTGGRAALLGRAALQGLVALAPRLEPAGVTRAWDDLAAILENSKDAQLSSWVSPVFGALAPRLEPAQAKRAWDALLGTLEKSGGSAYWESQRFATLAPRLDQAQVNRAANTLIAMLRKSTGDHVFLTASEASALAALAPRLEPAQAKRAWDALLAILEKSKGLWVNALAALAPRLKPTEVTGAGDAMIAIVLQNPKDDGVLSAASQGLTALAPRLEPAQVTRTADALIAILEKSKDDLVRGAPLDALVALAPRLERAQVARAGDALLAILEKSKNDNVCGAASQGLVALAPRLEPAQATRAWDALLAISEKSEEVVPNWATEGLVALAPRLEPARVMRAWDELTATMEKSGGFAYWESQRLTALVPRLESAQVTRAGDALIAILEKSNINPLVRRAASRIFVALAPRMKLAQVTRAGDILLAISEKSEVVPYWASEGLDALAPRLEPAQAKRACDALLATLDKSEDGVVRAMAWGCLIALAPRLDPASRDRLATKATTSLLECDVLLWRTYGYDIRGMVRPMARSITSQRSLAKLLSHPACVGESRESLLTRFEELVFYDGKPVFLTIRSANDSSNMLAKMRSKTESAEGKQPAHEQPPPRRFHNLHDAAVWIHRNWPDFDLEASCPATWRESN